MQSTSPRCVCSDIQKTFQSAKGFAKDLAKRFPKRNPNVFQKVNLQSGKRISQSVSGRELRHLLVISLFTSYVSCIEHVLFLYWTCIVCCIEHVSFGFFNYTSSQANQYFIINLIILLAKWHIHKCKYSNQKPLFVVFENETRQYMGKILCSRNGKAIKTPSVCALYNIFI